MNIDERKEPAFKGEQLKEGLACKGMDEADDSPIVYLDADKESYGDDKEEHSDDDEKDYDRRLAKMPLVGSNLSLDIIDRPLGPIAAQMYDCLTLSVSSSDSSSSSSHTGSTMKKKGSFVKGILSSGEVCFFFGMTSAAPDGTPYDPPKMTYYGHSRLTVIRLLGTRSLTMIRPEDVDLFVKQLLVFLTHSLDHKEKKRPLDPHELTDELPGKKRAKVEAKEGK